MKDPELFIRPDGLPMVFMMSASRIIGGDSREKIKQSIEACGGLLLNKPDEKSARHQSCMQ